MLTFRLAGHFVDHFLYIAVIGGDEEQGIGIVRGLHHACDLRVEHLDRLERGVEVGGVRDGIGICIIQRIKSKPRLWIASTSRSVTATAIISGCSSGRGLVSDGTSVRYSPLNGGSRRPLKK